MGRHVIIALASFATGLVVGGFVVWGFMDAKATSLRSEAQDASEAKREMQIELDRRAKAIEQLRMERIQWQEGR